MKEYNVSREDQDEFRLQLSSKGYKGNQKNGHFKEEFYL